MKVNITIYSTKHVRNFKCQVANSIEAIRFVKSIIENMHFYDNKTYTIRISTYHNEFKILYEFRNQVEKIYKSLTYISYDYDILTIDKDELEIIIKNIKYKGE